MEVEIDAQPDLFLAAFSYFLQGDKGSVTAGPSYTFDIEGNAPA